MADPITPNPAPITPLAAPPSTSPPKSPAIPGEGQAGSAIRAQLDALFPRGGPFPQEFVSGRPSPTATPAPSPVPAPAPPTPIIPTIIPSPIPAEPIKPASKIGRA